MQWQHFELNAFKDEDLIAHMQERQAVVWEGRLNELALLEAEADRNMANAERDGHSICKCGFSLNDV